MTLRSLFVLVASLPLIATGAMAEEYADTAAELAQAIHQGDTALQRELLPPLKHEEFAELAKLAGCDGYVGSTGAADYVVIDWRCAPDDAGASLSRTTTMVFDHAGDVFGFSINSSATGFAATAAAMAQADPPSARQLLRQFGEAVVNGGDPTLGGMIGLNAFDRARLARYADGHFRVSSRRRNDLFRIFLSEGKGRSSAKDAAILQLDDAGRPIGLVFGPTYFEGRRHRRNDAQAFGYVGGYVPLCQRVVC